MNKLTVSITHRFADQIGVRNILSKRIISGFLALIAYSTTSFADYTVWYDSETHQEHQLYNGSTLLTPPSWACARKFSMPSYYRHLNNEYGTLDSADFEKDVYVWIPKPGCPYTSEAVVAYDDGSQSFPPPVGAIAIEISTNYSSRWIDENGAWPYCNDCSYGSDLAIYKPFPKWDKIVAEIAILKSAINEKDFVKFDDTAARVNPLLTSFVKEINSSILEANSTRSKDDQYRLANIEKDALNQLSMASKQLYQCLSEPVSDGAYQPCDIILNNLHQFKSLWQSRD